MMLMKIETDKKGSLVVRSDGATRTYNKPLNEVITETLMGLEFNKEDAKIDCPLDNLESFIKKNFLVWIDESEISEDHIVYIVAIQMKNSLIKQFRTLKENGMPSLLEEAEDWSRDFIEQFNSDQQNTL